MTDATFDSVLAELVNEDIVFGLTHSTWNHG